MSSAFAAAGLTLSNAIVRERAVRVISLSHGNRSQKTFAIALALLAAVALAQLIGALVLYWQRTREARQAEAPAQSSMVAVSRTVAPPKSASAGAPPQGRGTTKTKRETLPAPPVSVPEELLQVAKALRLQGDTGNAVAKLQQAIALAPQNAEILAELALTYESMQLFDRSNATWRKLQSLGAAAGPLAELADLKLRIGVPVQGIPGSSGQIAGSGAAPNASTSIPDGSVFGIAQVTQTRMSDPDAASKLTLRVGVQARKGVPIDYTKVKIQVFFYDVVDNNEVVLTDADVSYEWITTGHDWKNTDTEVLDVTYLRPKKTYPAPGSVIAPVPDSVEKATREEKKKTGGADLLPTSESTNRQYLGYIVRVYYKDELQAVRADPTRLLNLFPPPFTAPPQ